MFRSDIVVQECVDVKQHCLSFARWPCCYCCHSENDCGNRFVSLNFIIFTGSLITSARSGTPSQTHWLEMQFSTVKFSVIKLLVKIMKFNELIPSQISKTLLRLRHYVILLLPFQFRAHMTNFHNYSQSLKTWPSGKG